jgi:hypothetical protein
MNPDGILAKRRTRTAAAILAVGAVLCAIDISPALARTHTFLSLNVGIPLYAGPPAYYYGPYYAPTYYAPPPVYYPPPPVVVMPAPVAAASCRSGLWRQSDGSVVNGVACLQTNGTWRLANY